MHQGQGTIHLTRTRTVGALGRQKTIRCMHLPEEAHAVCTHSKVRCGRAERESIHAMARVRTGGSDLDQCRSPGIHHVSRIRRYWFPGKISRRLNAVITLALGRVPRGVIAIRAHSLFDGQEPENAESITTPRRILRIALPRRQDDQIPVEGSEGRPNRRTKGVASPRDVIIRTKARTEEYRQTERQEPSPAKQSPSFDGTP